MPLSNKTIRDLAKALVPSVIDYVYNDDRYVEFMLEIIPDAIQDSLGNVDDKLKQELSFCIMDRMFFNYMK